MSCGKELLMVFVKNPVAGKVKTRLAATIGPDAALEVYHLLLQHTRNVALKSGIKTAVFYSDRAEQDQWLAAGCRQFVQQGHNLGYRMLNAFTCAFAMQYEKVIIIGSDCLELTPELVQHAFTALDTNDAVIGPAHDGGYYLLGLKRLHPELFRNRQWSTNTVLAETIAEAGRLGLTCHLLPVLSDIDEEADLASHLHLFPQLATKEFNS